MAHRPWRPYQPLDQQQRMMNSMQVEIYQLCQELGIIYPPTPNDVFQFIQLRKGEAERALNHNDLGAALHLYSAALKAVAVLPMVPDVAEEFHKLFCNRSLVQYKLARYREAKDDAEQSISLKPDYIKAYWRAAQACKKLPRETALPYLVDGLRLAQTGSGTTDDTTLFLSELCALVPKTPITEPNMMVLNELIVPTSDVIWRRVLQKLASNDNWEGVALIVIGVHSGPQSELDAVIGSHQFDDVGVGAMLKACTASQLESWGCQLAITMLQQGASYDEIGQPFKRPTVHVGVDIALRTGKLGLLKFILEKYATSPEKKNAQDLNGRTVYHSLIQSGQANMTVGEATLRVLISHRCNPMITDNLNKRPLDYLTPNDSAYTMLVKASKTVEELRRELESLKEKGNAALKEGRHESALTFYSRALEVSQQSKELYKEAAILYSNRANVLGTLKHYEDGLTNAIAAISCDSSWHKGYWWQGQMLRNMGSFPDAIDAMLDGYNKAKCTPDTYCKFLVEVAVLLTKIDSDVEAHYERLWDICADWSPVLARLCKDAEWKAIAYLLFGADLSKQRFNNNMTRESLVSLSVGVAEGAGTVGVPLKTVFQYLDSVNVVHCAHWVDATIYFAFCHGTEATLFSFCSSETDTPLHATVRFCLITGRMSLIHLMPDDISNIQGIKNGDGDSLFHTITKFRPLPEVRVIEAVTTALVKRGFNTMEKDPSGKLAVEYLDNKYPGKIFDIFFSAATNDSLSDINRLRNDGNEKFKAGNLKQAMELYTKAIHILRINSRQDAHNKLTNHEIAVLFGNRAEVHLQLKDYSNALKDAMESVSYDGHWHKAHVRVGRAQRGQGQNEMAVKAFVNGYCGLKDADDKTKVEVLLELATICMQVPRDKMNIHQRLPDFPRGQGAVWAQTAYELVRRNQWDPAAVAYFQYLCGEPSPRPVTFNLKPFCDLGMLKGYPWGLDLMLFFLDSGADRASISIEPGDRYLHAIVRMTLCAGRNNNLLEFVINKFTKPHSEENIMDIYGNTALHAATKEKGVAKSKRDEVIVILLKCDVDPTILNQSGLQAIDILPSNETQNHELLRMAMYKASCAFITRPARNVQSQNKHGNHHPPQPTETKVPEVKKQPAAGSECNKCDDMYAMAAMLLKEGNTLMAYKNLTDIFQLGHKTPRHEKIAQKCVTFIAKKLAETVTPEIPSCLTDIKTEYYSCIVETLANGNKWCQLHAVVRKYRMVNGPDKLKGFAKCLSVVPVVGDEQLRGKEELKLQIVENLLSSGATMGTDNGSSALRTAINLGHYKLVRELIKQGADTCKLSVSAGDTPIHAGVRIALEEKSLGILKILLQRYETNPEKYSHLNPDQFDASGDCLFHLVAKVKYSPIALNVVELLCKKNISSHYYNNDGKRPVDYILKKNDRRLQYLRLASSVQPSVPQEAKGDNSDSEDFQRYSRSDETDTHDQREVVKMVSEKEKRKRKIGESIRLLPDSEASIFSADHSTAKKATMKEVESGEANVDRQHRMEGHMFKIDSAAADVSNSGDNISSHPADRHAPELDYQQLAGDKENYKPILGSTSGEPAGAPVGVDREQPAEGELGATAGEVDDEAVAGEPELAGSDADSDDSDDEEGEEEQFNIDAQVFDNLEWEVECTADVWKALRDRHMLPEFKRRIVRKIQLLASGEWQPVLCKRLRNVRPAHNLNLFEAKFTRGSRILWELAVAFSPRCSETAEKRLQTEDSSNPVRGGRIYSEIIRVWDIVLDHSKIYRSVERIKKSHQRGETCIIQKKLHGIKDEDRLLPVGAAKRFPKLYAEVDVTTGILEEQQQYFPPASANDTEYHILKFYSFSSALVSHVLQNIDTKVDFPFRVTDLEHAIINLRSKAPILLLGRSGTGKTTCCLYRLWSQFHGYWSKAKEADCALLPRCVDFIHEEATEIDSEEDELPANENSEDEEDGACEADQTEVPEDGDMGQQYDHLHQIFITKNAVLCSEVMKNFRDLSHADELMQDRVALEEESLPCRLGDVDEHAFPLFLTSRQLLLMLDASTGPPHFFERKDDGSLKVDVVGWTDVDGPLDVLSLLDEDSDMEDDAQYGDHNADDDNEDVQRVATKKVKVDPRKEVTYTVFVEEIWPRIKKNERVSYHPSLVWVEIISFIKGSFEALSKPRGYLDKDEYIKLGKKRAPNFSGERDNIYKFFTRYRHFKAQNQLFDETDLVFDVFRRLQSLKEKPWVIHQIFVDETQDFTQAELCMLIRLCQNPNDMFLTGDTAQSIMRGVSFRFNDLRSLFFHARQSMHAMGKTSAVEVPKQVYQLTHNYRSHAGILGLASSILDLMIEFFPESFDRLNKDQGLFHGPPPTLLESCSFGDLAVLLRGNKRQTSHIEFGAHQAILVVNDAARDSIPEELRLGLILTIFEAKGLEFDDVLLYNFFKDSQASKEWRIVSSFLQLLYDEQTDAQASGNHDMSGLTQVDEAVLHEPNRPRPLEFDANLHKILNSELKHLYTALTRARVNVWIFDEDVQKRAPMFEYFKARKLVKCMTVLELDETNLSETMFAERSSVEDWVKRGEDFMKHALYTVAAKCFGMAEDYGRQKIALADGQALTASRLRRENPGQMREEFLHAAELYLECENLSKAAICLQNAREHELAVQLFEKLGQYDRAAEAYRRMKRPLDGSRCYEQLGLFDRAVKLLYDNERFDNAIDCLRRYELLVRDVQEKGGPLLDQLTAHKPDMYYTEERLSYCAAELYHKYKNEDRMLEALERLHKVGDRVDFLKNKGYIEHAAHVLEQNGQLREASTLLLMHGRWEKALIAARKTLHEETIANCLLIVSRININSHNKDAMKDELVSWLRESIALFKTCDHWDGMGESQLLLADLTGDLGDVECAWRDFLKSQPFPNEAGLVECTNWLVRHETLDNMAAIRSGVDGFGHLFNVCRVLLDPSSASNLEKARSYDQYYGLSPRSQTTLMFCRREKPRCLKMMAKLIKRQDKSRQVEVAQVDANTCIVETLLERAVRWLEPIWDTLSAKRKHYVTCKHYQVGLECPDLGNVDEPCLKKHKNVDGQEFQSLLDIDVMLIELEYNIQYGVTQLRSLKNCTTRFSGILSNLQPDEKSYKTCRILLKDLLPAAHHPLVMDACKLVRSLSSKSKVQNHMRDYLQEKWSLVTTTSNKPILQATATTSTNTLLTFFFGANLFGLIEKLDPVKQITAFESQLTVAFSSRKQNVQSLALVDHTDKDGRNFHVQSIARRFVDAYQMLSRSPVEPYEAVMMFSKFPILLSSKNCIEFFPDMKQFLFWVEFFCTLMFFLIARLNVVRFPDFVFILPANYLALVSFVEATFPRSSDPIEKGISRWQPMKKQTTVILQDRLKYMAFLLAGFNTQVKMFDHVLGTMPTDYAGAERMLVLAMVLVCNIGKAVPVECERSLLQTISRLSVSEDGPGRLRHAVTAVKAARGIADIAAALQELVTARGDDTLLVCRWIPNNKTEHIQKTKLRNVSLFSRQFLNEKTLGAMKDETLAMTQESEQPIDLHTEGAEYTKEEIQKIQQDQHAHQVEEFKKRRAGRVITRFLRWVVEGRRKGLISMPVRRNITAESENDEIFSSIQVDKMMCGYCGVSFEQKLSEQLQIEHSQLIGDKSVMNQATSPSVPVQSTASFPTSSSKLPTSPDGDATSPGPVLTTLGDEPRALSPVPTSPAGEPTNPSGLSWRRGILPASPGEFPKITSEGPWGPTTPMTNPHDSTHLNDELGNWPNLGASQQHRQISEAELRQKKLEAIRMNHLQSQDHMQKESEFRMFQDKYRKRFSPMYEKVMAFLHKPATGRSNLNSHDRRLGMEIERMGGNCRLIDQHVQMMLARKTWSNFGKIEQAVTELNTDYRTVEPLIQEILARQKQEERSQPVSAPHGATAGPENWEDERIDDIVEVVYAPATKPRKQHRSRIIRGHRNPKH